MNREINKEQQPIYKQYWLGEVLDKDEYGTVWKVKLSDGSHREPEGVVQAAKIINSINFLRDPRKEYVMVTIEQVPEIKVEINQEASDVLNEAHKQLRKK